jgi:hypothetical protein
VRNPGCDLQRGQRCFEGGPHGPRQRRRVGLGIEDAPAPAPPRRIHEHGVVRGRRDLRDIRLAHLDQLAEPERVGVRPRHGRRQRVPVDGEHPDPGPGERDRVATDAAAQVRHGPHTEFLETPGPVRGHARPGRLLHPVRREVHPPRVRRAELHHGPLPQPRLPERGGDEFRGVLAPQPGRDGQLLSGFGVPHLVEQGTAPVREQGGE